MTSDVRPAVPGPRVATAPLLVLGESLYRQLVAVLPQSAVYLFDRDLRFVLADGEAMRRAGLDPSAVVGRRLADIVAPRSLAVLEPAYRAALRGEDVELDHHGEDGVHLYRVRLRPVRSDDGEVIGGLVVTDDITEQRAAERVLAESQQRWQRLFSDAPVGMWLAEPGPDGRLLEVNDALCALLETPREQLLQARKADLLSPDDPQAPAGTATPVGADGGPGRCERRLVLADGTVRWLSSSVSQLDDGAGPRTLAHVVDVTASKQAEEQVREAASFRDAVLTLLPDAVHVADAALGTHVWASKGLAEAVTLDRDLLVRSVEQVLAADDGEVVHVRHRALDPDGSVRWLDRRKTPFARRPDGSVDRYLSVVRDVTDEVAAEQALRSALAFQEAVLAASPHVVSVYDRVQERRVWTSGSLTDLLGYGLEDVQQLQDSGGPGALFHPDDAGVFEQLVRDTALVDDGEVVEGVHRVRHADGGWRHVVRRSTPFLRDADGQVVQVLSVSWDRSEEVERERELEQVRSFQQAVLATTPDVVLVIDAETGAPTWSSRGLTGVLGWTSQEIAALGEQPFEQLVLPDDLAEFQAREMDAWLAGDGLVVHCRYRARHRDGSVRWLSRRMTPFARDDRGEVASLLVIVRDVTDVVQAEHALEHAALHDPLTGLPNRRLVADRLGSALAATGRGGSVGVLFLDLDGFKRVNDAHGHVAGDAVLREVAARLQAVVRDGDTVGRMGGDEFVVLLGGRGEPVTALAQEVGERLRAAIALPVPFEGSEHRVTASIGVAYAGHGDDPNAVLRDADTAMYRAKTSGKDRLATFDPRQHTAAVEAAAVERALREALEHDTLELLFQPYVATAGGQVAGYEALLRVPGPDGRWLDTQRAVAVAEQTGLIVEVGATVLRRACTAAAGWAQRVPVSVNLSAREVAAPLLFDRVTAVLAECGLPASRLVLELTETALLEATGSTVGDLERLRALGVGVAIDDFGTGYASLRYLTELPVTCVKVDRSFTAGLGSDPVCTTLVRATVGIARDLGLVCVVEGVETTAQLLAVGSGPHLLVQGYLLGRPGPVSPSDPVG